MICLSRKDTHLPGIVGFGYTQRKRTQEDWEASWEQPGRQQLFTGIPGHFLLPPSSSATSQPGRACS